MPGHADEYAQKLPNRMGGMFAAEICDRIRVPVLRLSKFFSVTRGQSEYFWRVSFGVLLR
jgi:hypothetical protein